MRYEMRREDIQGFVAFVGARTRENRDELLFERCPVCGGGDHKDKWTFSLNTVSGACCCQREKCSWKGHFVQLCRRCGYPLDYGTEEEEPFDPSVYGLPFVSNMYVVEYLVSRGISPEVTGRYQIAFKGREPKVLLFPFYDETRKLRFIKYRDTEWKKGCGGSKEWCRRGGTPILFGMDHCADRNSLVITEGQIDSLSLAEAGIPNPVSVPTGALGTTWIGPCRDFVESFKEIVVFGDCEKGSVTLVKMVAEAFPDMPLRVVRQEDYLGEKDANDILRKHGVQALRRCVDQAEPHVPEEDPRLLSLLEVLREEKPEQSAEYDDRLLGRLFARLFRHELRYNTTSGGWICYDGRCWRPDPGGMMAEGKAKLMADALLRYAAGTGSREFHKFVLRCGSYRCRKILVEDARSECFVSAADLDRQERYYNCLNCEIDLDTFEPVPHDPEHLHTRCSSVVFDEKARSPLWEHTLEEIFQHRSGQILYFQKLCGLTLTADTSQEKLWFLYGPTTRNGKSTVVEALGCMHGNSAGYALTMSPETLAQRKGEDPRRASGDIARLKGCRLLTASEPPKRMLFNGALVKQLTGGDTVVARHLMEREFEFRPSFKLLINTNYLPRIQDDTLFGSDRLVVIPFDRHFAPEEQDPDLKEKLRSPENIAGIFNWCLEGLRLYRETGMDIPPEIKEATRVYRENSDKLAQFLSEEMENTGRNSAAGSVYLRYAEWCRENGFGVESKRSFFDELKNKGIFGETGKVNGVGMRNIIRGYEQISRNDFLFT